MSGVCGNKDENCSKSLGDKEVPDYVKVITVTDLNGRKRKLVMPAALDLERPKRPRTIFNGPQLRALEEEFISNKFVTGERRTEIALNLKLSEKQVKVWFQNRRTKLRRQSTSSENEKTVKILERSERKGFDTSENKNETQKKLHKSPPLSLHYNDNEWKNLELFNSTPSYLYPYYYHNNTNVTQLYNASIYSSPPQKPLNEYLYY